VLDVTRVNILFSVTDKKGRFINDLNKSDFEIIENKKQQTSSSSPPNPTCPAARRPRRYQQQHSDRFRFEQEAADRFVQSVVRPRQDRLMLVSFDSVAELVSDLTDDVVALEKGINGMRPGGGTALYDAVFFAAKEKLMMDQPRDKFRRPWSF